MFFIEKMAATESTACEWALMRPDLCSYVNGPEGPLGSMRHIDREKDVRVHYSPLEHHCGVWAFCFLFPLNYYIVSWNVVWVILIVWVVHIELYQMSRFILSSVRVYCLLNCFIGKARQDLFTYIAHFTHKAVKCALQRKNERQKCYKQRLRRWQHREHLYEYIYWLDH